MTESDTSGLLNRPHKPATPLSLEGLAGQKHSEAFFSQRCELLITPIYNRAVFTKLLLWFNSSTFVDDLNLPDLLLLVFI